MYDKDIAYVGMKMFFMPVLPLCPSPNALSEIVSMSVVRQSFEYE